MSLRTSADSEFRASYFFRTPAMQYAVINPAGSLFAAITYRNEQHHVEVRRATKGSTLEVMKWKKPISGIQWAGDDVLLIQADDGLHIARVFESDDGLRSERFAFSHLGWVVDALPNDGAHFLYAPEPQTVYEISIPDLLEYGREYVIADPRPQLKRRNRVARLRGDSVHWIADHGGNVRVAVTQDLDPSPTLQIWYRDEPRDKFRSIYRFSDAAFSGLPIWPVGFAPDGRNFYVFSNHERDTYALFEFDVDTGSIGSLIFERDGVDLDGVALDYSGKRILAAYYNEGGVRRFHHIGELDDRYRRSLEHAFSGESVVILSASREDLYLLVFASNPRNPGAFYLLNTETNEAKRIGQLAPWLGPEDLMEVKPLTVLADDGARLEAFLTLPRAQEKPPLVVMPHGGPIGVRDERSFDPASQYLAAQDFAVLQVNYRGSWGYGKAFLEAGKQQWGLRIEDDLDAVLDHVSQLNLVDSERVCIAGASYGGYSALMSVVRRPERFRCAASMAGVTDIPLMFNRSDISTNDLLRDAWVEIVGDPKEDYDRMRELSPAYRASEITVPIFVAHGIWDERVDVDHAFRLMNMLDLYDKPYEWLLFEEASHDLTIEQARTYYISLANFLWKHLAEPY
jgi:dipeptidyl aminopeptidase/acylaminoacyl peptidase